MPRRPPSNKKTVCPLCDAPITSNNQYHTHSGGCDICLEAMRAYSERKDRCIVVSTLPRKAQIARAVRVLEKQKYYDDRGGWKHMGDSILE